MKSVSVKPFRSQSHHSWFRLHIYTHLRTEVAAIAPQKAIIKNVALFLLVLVIICSRWLQWPPCLRLYDSVELSISSVRKTDYLHAQSIYYLPSLSLSLSVPASNSISWLSSRFLLNQSDFATTSVSQSSCCCQSLKLVPFSAAVSCHFSVRSMWPSSAPITSRLHHKQSSQLVLPMSPSEALLLHLIHPDLQHRSSSLHHHHQSLYSIGGMFLYLHHYPLKIWLHDGV